MAKTKSLLGFFPQGYTLGVLEKGLVLHGFRTDVLLAFAVGDIKPSLRKAL